MGQNREVIQKMLSDGSLSPLSSCIRTLQLSWERSSIYNMTHACPRLSRTWNTILRQHNRLFTTALLKVQYAVQRTGNEYTTICTIKRFSPAWCTNHLNWPAFLVHATPTGDVVGGWPKVEALAVWSLLIETDYTVPWKSSLHNLRVCLTGFHRHTTAKESFFSPMS